MPIREIAVVLGSVGMPLIGMMALIGLSASLGPLIIQGQDLWVLSLLVGCVGAVSIGSALLPTFAFAGFCGWLFKDSPALGGIVSLLALLGGTCIGLYWGRMLKDWIDFSRLASMAKAGGMTERLKRLTGTSLHFILIALRLSPHMPFALTNLVVGRLPQSLLLLSALSFVGLLPRSVLAWYVGHSLGSFSDWKNQSPSLGLWGFGLTALLISLVWYLTKKGQSVLDSRSRSQCVGDNWGDN